MEDFFQAQILAYTGDCPAFLHFTTYHQTVDIISIPKVQVTCRTAENNELRCNSGNFAVHQLKKMKLSPLLIVLLILITCLLDNVLILLWDI